MLVDQYPGRPAREQEPQLLQAREGRGDIEFAIISSANTATISPQAGGDVAGTSCFATPITWSKSLADKQVDRCHQGDDRRGRRQGLHVIATGSQGVRQHLQARRKIHNVGDLKGVKIRVQGRRQPRMRSSRPMALRPCTCRFGSGLHLACRTGVMDAAEETASTSTSSTSTMRWRPWLSITEHEANNALFVCQRQGSGRGLSTRTEGVGDDGPAAEVQRPNEPAKGRSNWRRAAATKLKGFFGRQDRRGTWTRRALLRVSDPYLDKLAKEARSPRRERSRI